MFDKSAKLYDTIYRSFKDYRAEATKVGELISKVKPDAKSVLDVACGTGEHGLYLKDRFDIDGIDLNDDFLALAKSKNPSGRFEHADMIDFDLGKKYDVVMCLFSSIGYVKTMANVQKTLRSFAKHLKDGGVVIIEAWLTPDQWKPGRPHIVTVDKPELKVCRMNTSETRHGMSYLNFHYLLGESTGVSYFTEDHELGLFTVEEMLDAFRSAGLRAEHDSEGIFGRSLYVAR